MSVRSGPRRGSLARRLTGTYLLMTLLVLVALSAAVYLVSALYLERRLEQEVSAQADFYASYAARLASDENALAGLAPSIVGLFASQADLTVRYFAASSGALLGTTQDIGLQPSQAALEELNYRSPTVFAQRSRDLPHRRYAARPVISGARTIGVVEVSRSTLDGERFLASMRSILVVAVLFAGLVSCAASVLLARRLSRPMVEIAQATQQIASGDLAVRVDVDSTDEVGQLARSVNDMADRLHKLEADRALFLSEISHDLRTPLAAIKGLLVNLIDAAGPEERSSLELADRETDRLVRLVNQVLDFARWRAGRLELSLRPTDVAAIARDAVTLNEARARHRNIDLALTVAPCLPMVSADRDRLQRGILNVLDNAIRYTPPGGQVVLTVAQRDAELQVSVADTGRGMTKEEQAMAFEPYYRGEGGGAGVGLAITRAVVEAHGGCMGIESEVGHGCRIWFALPL